MENAQHLTPENKSVAGDNFAVEELLNLTDIDDGDEPLDAAAGVTSARSSNSAGETPVSGDISCRSLVETQLSDDLCVPYEDIAELEWLSNFVEDSFSSEDIQNMNLITGGTKPPSDAGSETRSSPDRITTVHFQPEPLSIPGKARTKRLRAAPCDWASRLSILSPSDSPSSVDQKKKQKKRKVDGGAAAAEGGNRRCLHCATDTTPQWRTGPMGPKTLCNACGVRYKSGRLVPEYRPAASPTFVMAKHSNSHRKVMELRRQKEVQKRAYHQMFDLGDRMVVFDGTEGDDYLIHQYTGPDFQNLI